MHYLLWGSRLRLPGMAILLLIAAACSRPRPLTVGFKNFTEQYILGEILAQQIERRLSQKVERRNLSATLLLQQALVNSEIDLYPEYTGTALTTVLKLPPASDAATVLSRVRDEYRKRWKLEWLDPFGFDNSFALVIRAEDSRQRGVRTLSDAARDRRGWVLGVGYEFFQRPDGLPRLQQVYALRLKGQPSAMDLGLLYRALEQKQVDMVAASATDGRLSVMEAVVLQDDRGCFPPYEAAPIVRAAALNLNPGLRKALHELAGKLDNRAMQKLNYELDGKHRAVRDVARDFLSAIK